MCPVREPLYLKDLEAGDVEDPQEGGSLALGLVQGLVDLPQDPAEQTLKHGLCQGLDGKVSLTTDKCVNIL